MKMEPFWAQARLWADYSVLGSEFSFRTQNVTNCLELDFWAQSGRGDPNQATAILIGAAAILIGAAAILMGPRRSS